MSAETLKKLDTLIGEHEEMLSEKDSTQETFKMVIGTDHGIGADELNEIQKKIGELIEEETGVGVGTIKFGTWY